jgi:hypothetical protein
MKNFSCAKQAIASVDRPHSTGKGKNEPLSNVCCPSGAITLANRSYHTKREQHLLTTLAERKTEARGKKDGKRCPLSVGNRLL